MHAELVKQVLNLYCHGSGQINKDKSNTQFSKKKCPQVLRKRVQILKVNNEAAIVKYLGMPPPGTVKGGKFQHIRERLWKRIQA